MAGNAAAGTQRLARTLWRQILRTAAGFDSDRAARALLCSPLLRAAGSPTPTPIGSDTDNPLAEKFLLKALEELRAGTPTHSVSTDAVVSPVSVRAALSRQFAQLNLSEKRELVALEDGPINNAAGFSLLRYLGATLERSASLLRPGDDANSIASTSSERVVQAVAARASLRTGDYLAADPLAYHERCLEMVYAVTPMAMLVLEGASDESEGVGLIINAPSKLRLRQHDWMQALDVPLGGVFSSNPVFYGGDCQLGRLTMLHPHGDKLVGARRVTSHLYEGGYLCDAAQLVRVGDARPSDFLFFRGRLEWRRGCGLEAQLSRGEWIRPQPPGGDSEAERWLAGHGWASPNLVSPDALATEEGRLQAAWQSWASLVRLCDEVHAPLLRLRPHALKDVIVRAAHMPPGAHELVDERAGPTSSIDADRPDGGVTEGGVSYEY